MSDFKEQADVNNLVPCGCGRSATGFCTGLHNLSDEEWDAREFDEAFWEEKKGETQGTEK